MVKMMLNFGSWAACPAKRASAATRRVRRERSGGGRLQTLVSPRRAILFDSTYSVDDLAYNRSRKEK